MVNIHSDIEYGIRARVESYVYKARELFPNFNIPMPEVGFESKNEKTAGLAYGNKKVTFNPIYFGENDFWETTIGHEVAHCIVKTVYPYAKQAHGPEFRYVMRLFGLNENTHHNMQPAALVSKKEHKYRCKCSVHNVSNCVHNRIMGGRKYHCAKCKTHLIPEII